MALGDILLGLSGSEVLLTPYGRKHKIVDSYPSIREGRTASGRLVRDFGGTKKKQFVIDYSEIDDDNLTTLLGLENLMSELSLILYTTAVLHDDYTVLMKPIERQPLLILPSKLWGGITLTLDQV